MNQKRSQIKQADRVGFGFTLFSLVYNNKLIKYI